MHDEHIADSSFRYHGAGQLLSYMDHTERPIKNRAGLEMSDEEVQDFIDKSEQYEFERAVVFSPRDPSMTDQQLEEATRDSVQEYFDGSTVDYCYAVHRDKPEKGPDVHVALTGDIDDLYMNQSDLNDLRDVSGPTFKEKAETVEKEVLIENGLDEEELEELDERERRKHALEQLKLEL